VSSHDSISASKVVRGVFAAGTVTFFVVGLVIRDDPRWFAAAGTLSLVWWAWDILVAHVFAPFGDWFFGLLTGQNIGEPLNELRPTLDDTIRLLESHLEHGASEQVCVNAAIRLEELYRTVKKDPVGARRVMETVKERFPDAPEWERFGGANSCEQAREKAD
jgi:hypothetical protein